MKEARGHVKTAIVMARKKLSRPRAQDALKRADGFLHRIF